ncbi:MAG: hypothetical protein ACXWX4_04650, partial [Actinomycetota bacterium]
MSRPGDDGQLPGTQAQEGIPLETDQTDEQPTLDGLLRSCAPSTARRARCGRSTSSARPAPVPVPVDGGEPFVGIGAVVIDHPFAPPRIATP